MSSVSLPSYAVTFQRWTPFVLLFAAAIILRPLLVANSDVSWDLTLAEKWLDGQRLYVDVIEVNPPATVFLYVVPAYLGRLFALPAEWFVDGLVLATAAVSMWLSACILRGTTLIDREQQRALALSMTAVLTVLPAFTFGEREHIALIMFLPMLAISAVRSERRSPTWLFTIIAGVGGGITAIIKPHFALAIMAVAVTAAIYARSWRPLFALENWIAAGLLAAYSVLVVAVFPAFISDILPMVVVAYVPVKENWLTFIFHAGLPLAGSTLLLTWQLKRRELLKPCFGLLLTAAAGFSIAYIIQRKGWPYHSYPMLALILVVLALAVFDRWRGYRNSIPRKLVAATAVLIVGVTFFWMNVSINRTALVAPIQAIKPHPKILQISDDLSIGHPLTRQVHGIWVSRVPSLWLTMCAAIRRVNETLDPKTKAQLAAYSARDREMLTEDITHHRPDVILVQLLKNLDWLAWARSDPKLAEQLKAYAPYRTVADVLALRRIENP